MEEYTTHEVHVYDLNESGKIDGPQLSGSQPKRRKKLHALLISLLILVVLGGIGAYGWFIYIPNMPKNVFKKAVLDFNNSQESYTISGDLSPKSPTATSLKYRFDKTTDGSSQTTVLFTNGTFNPSVNLLTSNGIAYVKVSNLPTSKELSKMVPAGKPELAQKIAQFGDLTAMTKNQNKWFEIPKFMQSLFSQSDKSNPSNTIEQTIVPQVGAIESINGNSARKYSVNLNADSFKKILSHIDAGSNSWLTLDQFNKYAAQHKMNDNLPVDIWVNLKNKKIVQISYSGDLFSDASFSLKLEQLNQQINNPDKSYDLLSEVGYGLVNDQIFNKNYQSGATEADKEAVADLKAMKVAFEVFYAKNGYYPNRYDIAVGQADFVSKNMPGASLNVFRDPGTGYFVGKNGSKYAYVGQAADGGESCQKKDCKKFFLITTLSDGKEFQLNSEIPADL